MRSRARRRFKAKRPQERFFAACCRCERLETKPWDEGAWPVGRVSNRIFSRSPVVEYIMHLEKTLPVYIFIPTYQIHGSLG
jgi:hypothetical protein